MLFTGNFMILTHYAKLSFQFLMDKNIDGPWSSPGGTPAAHGFWQLPRGASPSPRHLTLFWLRHARVRVSARVQGRRGVAEAWEIWGHINMGETTNK